MKTFLPLLCAAGFLTSCETSSQPSSALPIAGQETSTATPGNATPIGERQGVDGDYHYHRKVSTEGMTPLGSGASGATPPP